jgi:hypothetical protein
VLLSPLGLCFSLHIKSEFNVVGGVMIFEWILAGRSGVLALAGCQA